MRDGGVLAGYWNSSPTVASSNIAGDNDRDHGVNPATYAAYLSDGVSSGPITLGLGLPTSEDSSAPSTPNGDASNNLTIDFGFYTQSIGNVIWVDKNDNGVIDGAEAPYTAGPITVTLLNSGGNVISTTVTESGVYTFSSVPSGTFVISITVPATLPQQHADDKHGGRRRQRQRICQRGVYRKRAVYKHAGHKPGQHRKRQHRWHDGEPKH